MWSLWLQISNGTPRLVKFILNLWRLTLKDLITAGKAYKWQTHYLIGPIHKLQMEKSFIRFPPIRWGLFRPSWRSRSSSGPATEGICHSRSWKIFCSTFWNKLLKNFFFTIFFVNVFRPVGDSSISLKFIFSWICFIWPIWKQCHETFFSVSQQLLSLS